MSMTMMISLAGMSARFVGLGVTVAFTQIVIEDSDSDERNVSLSRETLLEEEAMSP